MPQPASSPSSLLLEHCQLCAALPGGEKLVSVSQGLRNLPGSALLVLPVNYHLVNKNLTELAEYLLFFN